MDPKTAFEIAMDSPVAGTFDDVLMIPQKSVVIPSRVSLETMLSPNIPLHVPLVSADMDSVTNSRLSIALAKQGGIGFIWNNPDLDFLEGEVKTVKNHTAVRIDNPAYVFEDQTFRDVNRALKENNGRFSTFIVVDRNMKPVGLINREKTPLARNDDLVSKFMTKTIFNEEERNDQGYKWAYDRMRETNAAKLIIVDSSGLLKALYSANAIRSLVEGTDIFNRDRNGRLRVGVNVGTYDHTDGPDKVRVARELYLTKVERILKAGADAILIGTAHGHTRNVIEATEEVKSNFTGFEFDLIVGNVATYEGARDLFKAGADTVKAGVGPGSICTTRIVTGFGAPQVWAINETVKAAEEFDRYILADGGIKYSGDGAKALAAGASSVMIGSLFAGTDESPGEVIDLDGKKFKMYRGMGSEGAMRANLEARKRYMQDEVDPEKLVAEGVEGRVKYVGSVEDFVFQFAGGLRAALGYGGSANIKEYQQKVRFLRITAAGIRESHPHDITITSEAKNYSPSK